MRGKGAALACSIAVAALLAPMASAGAGLGGAQSGAKAASLNACKLLKNSEVVKAIGEPVASKRGGSSATGAKYCNWYGADKRVAQKGITLIAAKDFAKLRFKKYKKQLNANKPVKGVGDVAATDGQVLIARIGDHRFVYVSPLNSHSGITLDALKPLARKALNRIP